MLIRVCLLVAAGLAVNATLQPVAYAASAEKPPAGRIQLDETVISGNQELPKVLYILPWRNPQGLPELEVSTELTEAEVFRRLYPPAYRRELDYFETLERFQNEE